jgi:hypothetical protein
MGFSDLPISDEVAGRVLRLLTPTNNTLGDTVEGTDLGSSHGIVENSGKPTPKQFMANKKPMSDVERVTCLAFYLTHFRAMPQFKTIDLTHLNIEAAQPRMTNPTVAAKNAVTAQYLALAGGSKRQLGPRGESVVDALPDRSKVATFLADNPLSKRKKVGKKRLSK